MLRATLERSQIREACRTLVHALGSDLPIYGGIRLTATDAALTLEAQDGHTYVSWTLETLGGKSTPGSLIVPGRVLSRFTEKLVDDEVSLRQLDSDSCVVKAGETELELHCLPLDEWPRLERLDGEVVDLSSVDLDQLRRVLFALSDDDQRPVLKSVCINGTRAFATDTARLARAELTVDVPACNIPGNFLKLVLRSSWPSASLRVGRRRATLEAPNATWSTSVVDSPAPQIGHFFRTGSTSQLTFNSNALRAALDRLSVFGTGVFTVNLAAQQDGMVRLSIADAQTGEATEMIPCDGNWALPISFDVRHLQEANEAARVDDLQLEIADDQTPVVIRSEGFEQLLMARVVSTAR